MNKHDVAITVNGVYKSFRLPHESHNGIKQLVINFFNRKRGYEIQKVLDNVSFEVKKGDFFGIVGRNGSGKSTLLKLIAGVYSPDVGDVQVNGTLTPFIELGVGFNPDLTGRENVFLNGELLGFNTKAVEAMYEDIVEFAEIENFMDQKLKNYSSGMQVRLAFSIAIRAKSDILVLDEVLAVGDEAFQRKCFQYFAEIKKQGQTVILVTHSMDTVLQFCNKAMLIDKGHKTEIGTPLEIARIYRDLNSSDGSTINKADSKNNTETKYVDASLAMTKKDNKISFDVDLRPKAQMEDPIIAIGIYRDNGEQVYRWTSDEQISEDVNLTKHTSINIELEDVFPVGGFTVSLYIKKRDRSFDYATFNDLAKFEIKNTTDYPHATHWKIPVRTTLKKKEV